MNSYSSMSEKQIKLNIIRENRYFNKKTSDQKNHDTEVPQGYRGKKKDIGTVSRQTENKHYDMLPLTICYGVV